MKKSTAVIISAILAVLITVSAVTIAVCVNKHRGLSAEQTLELIGKDVHSKGIDGLKDHLTPEAQEDMDILAMDADLIDDFLEKRKDIRKVTKKVEINLVAKILKHSQDPKFIQLGEKLEELREKHERGLYTSIEFLKHLLELQVMLRQDL